MWQATTLQTESNTMFNNCQLPACGEDDQNADCSIAQVRVKRHVKLRLCSGHRHIQTDIEYEKVRYGKVTV